MRRPRLLHRLIAAAAVAIAGSSAAPAADVSATVRFEVPDAGNHHSGGYFAQQRGNVSVGAEAARTFDPFSFNWDGDVGDYDDGPRCTIHRQPFLPFLGHRLVRLCR